MMNSYPLSKQSETFKFLSEHFVIYEDVKDFVMPDEKRRWQILLFCLNGLFQIEVNGSPHTIKQNDIGFCTPDKMIAHPMMSPDFQGLIMGCSEEFAKQIVPNSANLWNTIFYLNQNFKIHLEEKEATELQADYQFIKHKITQTDQIYYEEMMRCLLQAFLYQTANALNKHSKQKEEMGETLHSCHQICRAFIELLSTTKPVPRSVQWYANRLCKTPRYLSTAIKRASGKTASAWIHEVLTHEVADALKNSKKSIKEISDELDFPNLSFFGRYVRQHLGCSPSEYRSQRCGGRERSN